jgi:hypothetical protein
MVCIPVQMCRYLFSFDIQVKFILKLNIVFLIKIYFILSLQKRKFRPGLSLSIKRLKLCTVLKNIFTNHCDPNLYPHVIQIQIRSRKD